MKTIQVYDPPMCCATGVCGADIDPDLVNFAAMLSHLSLRGRGCAALDVGAACTAFRPCLDRISPFAGFSRPVGSFGGPRRRLLRLDINYHRLRQSGIDEELFDFISGYEALDKSHGQ